MDRRQQLLGAFTLGLIVAAAAGCSDTSAYKAYTPADEAEPAATAPAVASETPPETSPVSDSPVAAEAVVPAVADAAPAAEVAAALVEPVAEPAVPVDVAAARPDAIAPAAETGDVTPASASEPDGTLIAAVGNATAVAVVKSEPRETKLLIPEKTFQHEGDTLRVSYDDIDLLKVLNMEPVSSDAPDKMPQWLKDLEGQRIRLRGYMRPGELSEELPFFVLARDTQACCFGPNTKAYDIIPVMMREGVTTDYIHLRPFDITGVFHINVEMDLDDPNKVEFLYYIDDALLIAK
jgi:hypothetical protein